MNNAVELVRAILQEAGALESQLKQVRSTIDRSLLRAEHLRRSLEDLATDRNSATDIGERGKVVHETNLIKLSANESRILSLISKGLTNNVIASQLHLSEKTVRNYVSSIFSKLQVCNRTEAAIYLTRVAGSTQRAVGPEYDPEGLFTK